MKNRNNKNCYVFLSTDGNIYYNANIVNGEYSLVKLSSPRPISHNPANIDDAPQELSTNSEYNSLYRSISHPLEFIKDGAYILRTLYLSSGVKTNVYVTVVRWDSKSGLYILSYRGKVEFLEKSENIESDKFIVPTVDDTAWGVLSSKDDVKYSIDCSYYSKNPVRVLIDGIDLIGRFYYKSLESNLNVEGGSVMNSGTVIVPISFVSKDGDSVGIVSKSQQFVSDYSITDINAIINNSPQSYIYSSDKYSSVSISGTYSISLGAIFLFSGWSGINFESKIITSLGQEYYIHPYGRVRYGFSINFNWNIQLSPGEKIYIACKFSGAVPSTAYNGVTIKQTVSSFEIESLTRQEPAVCYARRPLDVAREIVKKATNNAFTINSDFLDKNNNRVLLSGESLRGIENPTIEISFKEFFKIYDCEYWIALNVVNGELNIDKFTSIYNNNNIVADIGEIFSPEIFPASELYVKEILTGFEPQDSGHPSGRLEFNSKNTFSINFENVDKKLDIVSPARGGCYDISMMLLDNNPSSKKDKNGDKSIYILDISNSLASVLDSVPNHSSIEINKSPLSPVITRPYDNSFISNKNPRIKGIGKPNETVYIYVDDVLDGSTVCNQSGDFSYVIQNSLQEYIYNINTGTHKVQATFIDLLSPNSTIFLCIDMLSKEGISYPSNGDTIIDNKPIIKAKLSPLTTYQLKINGATVSSVTSDENGSVEYNSPVLNQGNNKIEIGAFVSSFSVSSYLSFPTITSIKENPYSISGYPLISGVSKPNTQVDLYVDYISYAKIGSAVSDSSGNWSIQLVNVSYTDPLTNTQVPLVPLKDGINVISTSLSIQSSQILSSAYILNRPNYSVIDGVYNNTVFNVELSPVRKIFSRKEYFASILYFNKGEKISFQTHDRNANLRTILNGVEYSERKNITYSSLGSPIFIPEKIKFNLKSSSSFLDTIRNMSSGGVIKASYNGNDIYMMPIGSMISNSIVSDIQTWTLLLSSKNNISTIRNLYKKGKNIKIMKNSIFRSDYNSLHFVVYNFVKKVEFNHIQEHEDYFSERNSFFTDNPTYVQKYQKSETIVDQIISSGISDLYLNFYRCIDAKLYKQIQYSPVTPQPIVGADVVMECIVDFSTFDSGTYFSVLSQKRENPLGISVTQGYNETPNLYVFSLSGSPNAGEVVKFDIYDGATNSFSHIVSSGQSVLDILISLKDKINQYYQGSGIIAGITLFNGQESLLVNSSNIVEIFYSLQKSTYYNNIAISERVMIADKFDKTILVRAKNSLNSVGCFFSTGFETIIRVEGFMGKLFSGQENEINKDSLGNAKNITSVINQERLIRFGNAFGIPDYIANKIILASGLDDFNVEGQQYVIKDTIEKGDETAGHPLYYYDGTFIIAENSKGKVFSSNIGSENGGVIVVVDASAFGIPSGGFISIDLV